VIQHHPDRALAHLRRILVRRLAHKGSTFSGVGASGKPGAVHVFTGAIVNVDSNFTPKHALAVTADYTVRPFTFADLRFHLDANTAGNYIANNTVTYKADSAVLVNGRVTLGDISLGGSTLDVALWGKNLTNAKFRAFDWRTAGRQTTARYNEPITYGLEARLRF
jgi:iron complex outermembrane receptor protein